MSDAILHASPRTAPRFVGFFVVGLLAFVALNALGGGLYGLAGARDVPPELLSGTPFSSYFVPSLILLLVVGGSQAYGAIAVLTHARSARLAVALAGGILVGWMAVQLAMIGLLSWLQPAMLVLGLGIMGLAGLVPAPDRR